MALAVRYKHSTPLIVGTGLTTLALDQLTKVWAVAALSNRTIDIVWTLRLNLTTNTGFAFSAGAGLGPLLALLVPIIVVVLWRFRRRVTGTFTGFALGLILGGAVGNLVDRLVRGDGWGRGGVIDFIDFQFWPVFNLADAAIVVGVVVLTLYIYHQNRSASELS